MATSASLSSARAARSARSRSATTCGNASSRTAALAACPPTWMAPIPPSSPTVGASRAARAICATPWPRWSSSPASKRPFRSHWLRHSNATLALAGGAPLLRVQQDLGHGSLAITQHYLHLAAGLKEGFADFIGLSLEEEDDAE